MQKTEDNKILIDKTTTDTIDLIQLDTEIAHLKDVINQTQLVLNEKQKLRDSITETFPEIESAVYSPLPVEPVIT